MDIKSKGGTQSIRRALHLLRLIAQNEDSGLSLQELTQLSGLERSTAHRVVACLMDENFVRKDAASKRYELGIDAMQIGFSAMHRIPIADELRPLAKRLCRLSDDTVFLVAQQGDHALCLAREHGDFPVRIFTIDAGEKRLMGIGAGGLALIAGYSDEEIAHIHARHTEEYEQAGLPLRTLMLKARQTRRNGYSEIVDGITQGVSGVGYAFSLSQITRVAISFGAINPRLDAARRKQMGELLARECKAWVQARQQAGA
ncbi:helix-turn-helix domain-containing protein [Candidimonas humi]|jgi:DNA-binding IclR family transcriptional regulator|uniref:IclR family transcriptional regulator n=1 Tax=Candidimonas humi TaxID=683355 RepID=A0ABV8P224_9BURK|nr:helix-turn-helix domain-containing protein [Candidimonas humi]MBV6306451.1 helix-turn-helix domain-containing protein [Candidimonas humi]